jgi:hypothetical protein
VRCTTVSAHISLDTPIETDLPSMESMLSVKPIQPGKYFHGIRLLGLPPAHDFGPTER